MNHDLYCSFQTLLDIAFECRSIPADIKSKGEQSLRELAKSCADLARDYGSLYDMAVGNYGKKLGIPPEREGEIDSQTLDEALEWVEDARLMNLLSVPPTKGFSGVFSRKVRGEEYRTFCQSALLLKRHYEDTQAQTNTYLRRFHGDLPRASKTFLREARLAAQNTLTEGWDAYPVPPDERGGGICIGDITDALGGERELASTGVRAYIERDGDDLALKAPFSYRADAPFRLFVRCEGRRVEGERLQAALLRSVVYQILHSMAPSTCQILYIDPAHGGETLGEIQSELKTAVDGNAYLLNHRLYHDRYVLLRVARTRDEARNVLKELDETAGVINELRGERSVAEYNADKLSETGEILESRDGLILHTFVIYENIHGQADDDTLRALSKLADARKSGFSLLVTSLCDRNEADDGDKPADDPENELLRHGMDLLEMDETGVRLHVLPESLGIEGGEEGRRSYHFIPCPPPTRNKGFLEKIAAHYHVSLNVDTMIESWVDLDAEWGRQEARDCIEFPIGVNERNRLATLQLGNSENVHAIVAGTTSCGKSSFLHLIINSVIARYHPDDVQLWLVDYKLQEFKRYTKNTPPHVKYIGLADSMEFTFSLLDRLNAEYDRRQSLFNGLTGVGQYRKEHGAHSMPRLLIIVDEFHKMTQHCRENPEYSQILGNLLRQCRFLGMTFLFSDQTFSVGLQGLPEDGKEQLTCRMAMRLDKPSDYNELFAVPDAAKAVGTLLPHRVVVKRFRMGADQWGNETVDCYFEQCRTLFVSPEKRDEIAARSIADYGKNEDVVRVEQAQRGLPDWAALASATSAGGTRGTAIHLGIPLRGGGDFSFPLLTNFGENISVVCPNDGMSASLIVSVVESFRMGREHEIYVIASQFDSLYERMQPWLDRQRGAYFHVAADEEEICRTIADLSEEMERRRKQRTMRDTLVIWIGLPELERDFSYYPEGGRPNAKPSAPSGGAGMSDAQRTVFQFDAMFIGAAFQPAPEPEGADDEPFLYNAVADVRALVNEGARRAIHSLICFPGYRVARQTRCVDLGDVKHRIGNALSTDDATDYLGASRYNRSLDGKELAPDVAVYAWGAGCGQILPYLSELEPGKGSRGPDVS